MQNFGQIEAPFDPVKPHFYTIKPRVYSSQAFFKVRHSYFEVIKIVDDAIHLSVETA